MTDLGTFVRDARLRRRMPNGRPMSQEALAAAAGVSGATISHIESGKMRRPERETLEALAAALGVTYNDLAYAANYADPPTERDIEHEIRRIAALPTIEARMGELRRLSPEMYGMVQAWAMELVRRAGGLQREDTTQAQQEQGQDQSTRQSGGHRSW